MRVFVVVVLLALATLYFTLGLRLGYLILTPTYMWNATGMNHYTFRVFDENQSVGVRGSCTVKSGKATFRLINSSGTQIAGQVCPRGKWGLNVMGSGDTGHYRLNIRLEKFTGTINIKEARQ
ncbi:hypothetical protein [Deinococcus arenicola]|uniref:Uncharacterized protein n=1 Tax=Deinococcus arenicola TaxID=2994950 RepID=A0ABU4DN44_9DEIO|nr:hypothetical protein [Deinococcus sp. ZS9-10]MDV6373853.1 hypothetical protein [Deinococcus sp. ZS9-10]